jgi:hypothetical protein
MATEFPGYTKALAWFLRAASLIVVVVSLLDVARHGWSWDFTAEHGPKGILMAAALFTMSFGYTRTGKPRRAIAVAFILLAVLFLGCLLVGWFR